MQAEGMTIDDLRQVMERQMLINQVQQVEIMAKVTLTDIEAREYYENNLNDYTEPATVTMREILIRVPEGGGGSVNVAADESAQREAAEARQRVLAGEDFALVAVAVSDAASKANGGLIGPLDLAVVNDTVQAVLVTMEIGEVGSAGSYASRVPRTPARGADRTDAPPVRRGPRHDRQQRVQRAAGEGVLELSRPSSRRGGHRVEGRAARAGL